MKKIMINVLCALFSVSVFGQTTISEEIQSSKKPFEFTLSIGYGTTVMSEPYENAKFNLNAGIDLKKNIVSLSNKVKLYGLAGLHYTQRGGLIDTTIDKGWLTEGNSLTITQFNIPIHLGLKRVFENNWRIFADFGPFIGLNGSYSLSDGFGDNDFIVESNTTEFGLGYNMGICFKKFGISVGLDYDLTSIAKVTSEDMHISKHLKSGGFYFKLQWTFNKQ